MGTLRTRNNHMSSMWKHTHDDGDEKMRSVDIGDARIHFEDIGDFKILILVLALTRLF